MLTCQPWVPPVVCAVGKPSPIRPWLVPVVPPVVSSSQLCPQPVFWLAPPGAAAVLRQPPSPPPFDVVLPPPYVRPLPERPARRPFDPSQPLTQQHSSVVARASSSFNQVAISVWGDVSDREISVGIHYPSTSVH